MTFHTLQSTAEQKFYSFDDFLLPMAESLAESYDFEFFVAMGERKLETKLEPLYYYEELVENAKKESGKK